MGLSKKPPGFLGGAGGWQKRQQKLASVFGVGPGSLDGKVSGKESKQRAEQLQPGGRGAGDVGAAGLASRGWRMGRRRRRLYSPKWHRGNQKRLQRIEEVSANLRKPRIGELFCFLTKSQKSLAKLELSNREGLKIAWRDLKKFGRGSKRLQGHFSS